MTTLVGMGKRVMVHIDDGCDVIPFKLLSATIVNHIVVNLLFVSSQGFKRVLSQAVGQSQSSRHAVCIKARRISQSDVKSSPPQMKPSQINSIGATSAHDPEIGGKERSA